jgi:protein O-GlcNAc transferase
MSTTAELLAAAIDHHQSGRLSAAERICRQMLEIEPDHAEAIYLLGVIAYRAGKTGEAAACWQSAIHSRPGFAEAHNNLGVALKDQGMLAEAAASYRRAIELNADYAEAHNNLGVVLKEQGHSDDAAACYRRALQIQSTYAEAYHNLGEALKDQGKTQEAIDCYGRALELKPDCAEAHNNLGVALVEIGKVDEAAASFRRAIQFKPGYAEAFNNLGNALKDQGRLDDAIAAYRRALELEPDFTEAHNNLGVALKDQGSMEEAVVSYRRALEINPDFAEAHINLAVVFKLLGNFGESIACCRRARELQPDLVEADNNLGNALREHGLLEEAIACYQQALRKRPDYAEVHSNLGNALHDLGRLDEAVASYRRAIELRPDLAEVHSNLGVALGALGQLEEAISSYRRAVELKPDFAEAHSNLGIALREQGQLDEAAGHCLRALQLKPDYAAGHINLGVVYKDQGRLEEAIAAIRRALVLKPDLVDGHSNLLYAMIFCPGYSAAELAAEHRRWDKCHAAPLADHIEPHGNDRSPERRLRIGYVSPDFRNHCQAFFTVPLFAAHDHQNYEIVCYADVPRGDSITDRLRGYADIWRATTGVSHQRLAAQIRADGIDILVDLSMHMARNRMLVFARKPTPVQVTWLAYPGTTGLSAMDYRITDPHLDPPGLFDRDYSEESIRLPDSFWCYDPLVDSPDPALEVSALPALARGHVTFGCLNNFCKVNRAVLKLWAEVLKAVGRSRLMMLANEGSHRRRTLDFFAAEGIGRDRVTFVSQQPRPLYLKQYHGIDIGLDTFPYNGHTTSLDSFWMGVPVVTLCGQTVVGRAGLCQLTNLGMPDLIGPDRAGTELVAATPEEYVRIAAELAGDLPRLAHLRSTLRARMEASPLMDAPRFARNLEAAYRHMWRRWCAG